MSHRAPKQWSLQKHETLGSFESWKNNQLYCLRLDSAFSPYLQQDAQWGKKSKSAPFRGFQDDGVDVIGGKTKEDKAATLELLLGQIANFCPVISRNTITKNCTSLNEVWQIIRAHYGFQSNGAHFIDFDDIKMESDDRPEDLYQRLMAFVEDNLLLSNNAITHHGATITEDEELTPTLENLVVLSWLRLLHPNLPRVVKQKYGTQLRKQTLASLRSEISQAMDSLLSEARQGDTTGLRSSISEERRIRKPFKPKRQKSCPLCKTANKPSDHFLSECKYLPDSDKRYISKARLIAQILDDDEDHDDEQSEEESAAAYRVMTQPSPHMIAFYKHHPVRLTLDSGATGNLMRASTAHALQVPIEKSTQTARQVIMK